MTVALETGMRHGEIMGLTWDRVDPGVIGWRSRSRQAARGADAEM